MSNLMYASMKEEILQGLKQYFYNYQYDEERYPHFRPCDMNSEFDMDGNKHIYYIFYDVCENCFLIECCCEQDRLEGEQDRQKEIEMYHNAPVGSRLHRKIKECPCGKH